MAKSTTFITIDDKILCLYSENIFNPGKILQLSSGYALDYFIKTYFPNPGSGRYPVFNLAVVKGIPDQTETWERIDGVDNCSVNILLRETLDRWFADNMPPRPDDEPFQVKIPIDFPAIKPPR